MRRAIVATAGTVVGLVALLSYKSSSPVHRTQVSVGAGGSASSAGSSSTGSSSAGSSSPSTTAPANGPSPSSTAPSGGTTGTFTGQDVPYAYGDIQIAVTFSNGRITSIAIPREGATDPRSQYINSQAVPILKQEALAAQGVNIDVVSGATFTSDAFGQAMQSALSKAGK